MFLALNEHLKTDLAFGSMEDVENPELEISDKMESFFVAETLKYLYLLQDPNSEIDILRKHVFNTEAHPLRILDEIWKIPIIYLNEFQWLLERAVGINLDWSLHRKLDLDFSTNLIPLQWSGTFNIWIFLIV